jgi:hypothetical protein
MTFELRTFLSRVLFYVPLPILVIAINLYVDPAHIIRRETYVTHVAQLMLEGKTVSNVLNFDERLLQKLLILSRTQTPDIINLGSSSSQFIRPSFFNNKVFYNHFVSSATIQDYLALFELYEQKNVCPSTVFVGTDIWILNGANNNTRWKSLYSEYRSALSRLHLDCTTLPKPWTGALEWKLEMIKQCISPSYFRESVRTLWVNRQVPRPMGNSGLTTETDHKYRLLNPDGSTVPSSKEVSLSIDEIRQEALKTADLYNTDYLQDFKELDPWLKTQFEAFVQHLQTKGVTVIFILPPIHPAAYERMVAHDKHDILKRMEAYYKQYAKSHGIECYGSYEPARISSSESMFYDGFHPKEEVFRNIIPKS